LHSLFALSGGDERGMDEGQNTSTPICNQSVRARLLYRLGLRPQYRLVYDMAPPWRKLVIVCVRDCWH
jgi:hypothetical protein